MAEDEKKSPMPVTGVIDNRTGKRVPIFLGTNAEQVSQAYTDYYDEADRRIREEEEPKIEPRLRIMRALLFQQSLNRTGGVRDGVARNPNPGIDLSRLSELAAEKLKRDEGLEYSAPVERITPGTGPSSSRSRWIRGAAELLDPKSALDPKSTSWGKKFDKEKKKRLGPLDKGGIGKDPFRDSIIGFFSGRNRGLKFPL